MNYYVLPTLSLFSNFPGVNRATLHEYNDARRNPNFGASKWPSVANFHIHFVLGFSGAGNKKV